MEFQDILGKAKLGGAVLFCGAGFSADCLNLSENKELGAGNALLELLNKELSDEIARPFRDLKNAADKYVELKGESGLLSLLRNRFKVSNVTDDMVEIIRYPWKRIYTTNYDDAIQAAFMKAGKRYKTFNNLDSTDSIPGPGTDVIHLHGCADKWDIHNFSKSCVLGADSYYKAEEALGDWLFDLQGDFDQSTVFIFIGFAAGDLHLNRVFFNAREARSKVYFVNRPSADIDPDLQMTQEKFGHPVAIGRTDFAQILAAALASDIPAEPITPSFYRYVRPIQATELPSVEAIKELFLFGKIDVSQIARDISLQKSDYHVRRSIVKSIVDDIESGQSITLINSEICEGKSVVLEEISARLSLSRSIFILNRPYDTIVAETSDLISAHTNPVLIIENCFDLSSRRLDGVLKQFLNSNASLILTTRSISARAEVMEFKRLHQIDSLKLVKLPGLDDQEIVELSNLADQVNGWVELPRTHHDRVRFIKDTCKRSLPSFLMELLKSQFVKDRYIEEYRKTVDLTSTSDLSAVVAALYVAHIGHDAPLSFLSNIFKVDAAAVFDRLAGQNYGLHLVRVSGSRVKTVPSIGAAAILRDIVPAHNHRLVVDTIVKILSALSERHRNDDFENQMFKQLMRYSILSTVVRDVKEQNRFFDNVSKIEYCRTQVLFWLQWHIAMVDQKRFLEAEEYLVRCETEAKAYEKRTNKIFDRFQIHDRQAKFLMTRARNEPFRTNMINDIRNACQATERLLRRADVTHHPYETFEAIVSFYQDFGSQFPSGLRQTARSYIDRVGVIASERLGLLEEGFTRNRGFSAISIWKSLPTS